MLGEKPARCSFFPTKNFTWAGVESNPGPCGEKPALNRLISPPHERIAGSCDLKSRRFTFLWKERRLNLGLRWFRGKIADCFENCVRLFGRGKQLSLRHSVASRDSLTVCCIVNIFSEFVICTCGTLRVLCLRLFSVISFFALHQLLGYGCSWCNFKISLRTSKGRFDSKFVVQHDLAISASWCELNCWGTSSWLIYCWLFC